MTEELTNKTLMLSVIAAFQVGNLEPLFAALSPDVVWKATAPREFFRFGGTHRGIAGMREYTALLFSRYSFTRFTPKTLTAKVTIDIYKSVNQISDDSVASILTAGLLGEQYIGIVPGASDTMLDGSDKHNEIEQTQSALVLEDLIGKFLFNKATADKPAAP